jgi:hypothetical protein
MTRIALASPMPFVIRCEFNTYDMSLLAEMHVIASKAMKCMSRRNMTWFSGEMQKENPERAAVGQSMR